MGNNKSGIPHRRGRPVHHHDEEQREEQPRRDRDAVAANNSDLPAPVPRDASTKRLLVHPVFEPHAPAFNFLCIWIAATQSARARAGAGAAASSSQSQQQQRRSGIADLSYIPAGTVMQFLAGESRWRTQQTWGGSGSRWGGPPDLVLRERVHVSLSRALLVELVVELAGQRVERAVFDTRGVLSWRNEPGPLRQAKPVNGDVTFSPDAKTFSGSVQFPGEGPIGYFGRLIQHDKKTGKELECPPVQKYYGVEED
jgi:hypothetical protein